MNAADFLRWRIELNLSQTTAAHALGLSRRTVQNYENGAPIPVTVALACHAVMLGGVTIANMRRRSRRSLPERPAMRFAYADPPYLGQASLYQHPEAALFDDPQEHARLIQRLSDEYPDGWALSASAPSLPTLMPFFPPGTRLCLWVKPFASFKPHVGVAYAWEPVLLWRGRPRSRQDATVRDWLAENIMLRRGTIGAKPPRFCRWIFSLLNALPGDQLDDLFPGSGAVTQAWAEWQTAARPPLEIGGNAALRVSLPGRKPRMRGAVPEKLDH